MNNISNNNLIDASIKRSRAILLILVMIFISGLTSYMNIPKEDTPDVQIPIIYVSMNHEGISPEDAERLLIRPMEKELRGIEGIKELRSQANQGHASIILEFKAGFNSEKALQDVREKVDLAKPELPDDTDEPTVNEINLSLFPVVSVILTNKTLPERDFIKIARKLENKIEEIPSVLDVEIAGDREETIDIIIEPLILESYKLTSDIIFEIAKNNLLITAGAIDSESGRYQIKVPSLLENIVDILNLPIKATNNSTVRLKDIATIKKSYKDPQGYARVNKKPALVLEVSKRTGENIIDTIAKVREYVSKEQKKWPDGIEVIFSQDSSSKIKTMITDLQNNIIFAIFLVSLVIIAFIGIKSAILISVSIPGAFLIGILVISFLGLTLNMVVLFSLILSIGMLVDSAIIVIEYANRKIIEGMDYKKAYGEAAKRMAWPIITSTVTTLIVFAPLLFWPGIIGQFMKYLPLTLIATLSGSMLMALIFIPALGSTIGRVNNFDEETKKMIFLGETGDLSDISGFTGKYIRLLTTVIRHPIKFILGTVTVMVSIIILFNLSGLGTEFFPKIEPENAQVIVKARGNLSVKEKDNISKKIESKIFYLKDEVETFYTKSGFFSNSEYTEDVIAVINMEFIDWQDRRKSSLILEEIRGKLQNIPGVITEVREQKKGPTSGRAINVEIGSIYPEILEGTVKKIEEYLKNDKDFVDVSTSLPIPAIEWQMDVDRVKASKFGVDLNTIGNFIKLTSNGLKVSDYRPNDNDDEVDIMLRFPKEYRNISQLDDLKTITKNGSIPISNFVERVAHQKISRINRTDGLRVYTIGADVGENVKVNKKLGELKAILKDSKIDSNISIKFKGDDEQQKETGAFLTKAFILSLSAMVVVLLFQFNKFYNTFIIMSAVFLSSTGVFIGLLITGQSFGIVMCGVGIIALAGIVVNNNIIFIDTYTKMRETNNQLDAFEAIVRTGAQRLRPILLTAGTTVLGLIPMVLSMNINFITREVTFGAPSTQWWNQLSTAIAGGLSFATILTLLFTPCLLIIGDKMMNRAKIRQEKKQINPESI